MPTDGFFVDPTLLDNVTPDMACYDDEIFGPVLSVMRVHGYEDGVDTINANPCANGTAIFTRDGGAARQFQFDIQVGMVGINVPDPGSRQLLQLRWLEGEPVRRHPHVRPRGHQLLHAGQGRHEPMARPGHQQRRPRLPARPAEPFGRRPRPEVDMDIGSYSRPPPAPRVIDLAKRAETYGFSHVWTFDSHILWEEPYVIYTQILDETRNVVVGPMVTNPATRDWTVTASTYATLNEMYGNRTVCGIGRGDSAVRVTNGKPTTARHDARIDPRDPRARQRTQRRLQGFDDHVAVGSKSELEVLGRRLRPQGAEADRRDLRRLHPAARRPVDRRVDDRCVRTAASDAGRNPDDLTICVAAPAYVGDDLAYMRDQCRWFGGMVGNHVADIVDALRRLGAGARRRSPTTSRTARTTTTTSTARPATPTRPSCPTRSSIASASSAPSRRSSSGSHELARSRRRPVRDLPPARRQGPHAGAVRRARHPALREQALAAFVISHAERAGLDSSLSHSSGRRPVGALQDGRARGRR